MPRTKVGRAQGTYGKSITNVKKSLIEAINAIFSYDFVLERVKLAPAVLEFSIEESDPSQRHLEILKRLSKIDQSIPCIVLSEFRGTFGTGQVGSGPVNSFIDNETGKKYNTYGIFCTEGSQTLDIFAGDPDTRDALGDALTSGMLLYLRDINYTINKQFDTGKYTVTIDSEFPRTPGSDLPRQEDPEQKIVTESIEVKINYEEYIDVEAVPSQVYLDTVLASGQAFSAVYDTQLTVTVETNVPPVLKLGSPFQVKIYGGSGFYQFWSSNPAILNLDVKGIAMPTQVGSALVVVYDSFNCREFHVPVTVSGAVYE